jgi:hypothetical protein
MSKERQDLIIQKLSIMNTEDKNKALHIGDVIKSF